MGVDDVGDANLGLLGLLDEPVLVARNHIHRDRHAVTRAAEEIGQGCLFGRQLLEKHGIFLQKTKTLSASTVQSANWANEERFAPSINSLSVNPRASMQVPHKATSPLRMTLPSMS